MQIRPITGNEIIFPIRKVKVTDKDNMVEEEKDKEKSFIPKWTIQTEVVKNSGESKDE